MTALLAITRAVHFGAVLWLLGEFVFFTAVLGGASRSPSANRLAANGESWRRLTHLGAWSVAIAIASAFAWLFLEAASMSGAPLAAAMNAQTLETVLEQTLFGRVWTCRLVISALLIALLLVGSRKRDREGSILPMLGAFLAGAYAATLAWTGHATADIGTDRTIHLGADAVHALAAGAWVGALPGLISLLKHADESPEALARVVFATRRFSTIGVIAVSVVLVSGVINASYLLGSIAALLGTEYGRLLLCKLLLFAFMLVLAANNRLRETPRLAGEAPGAEGKSKRSALMRLRRNAMLEVAAGVAIVGIVAVLGLTMPAAHMARHAQAMPTMTESHER